MITCTLFYNKCNVEHYNTLFYKRYNDNFVVKNSKNTHANFGKLNWKIWLFPILRKNTCFFLMYNLPKHTHVSVKINKYIVQIWSQVSLSFTSQDCWISVLLSLSHLHKVLVALILVLGIFWVLINCKTFVQPVKKHIIIQWNADLIFLTYYLRGSTYNVQTKTENAKTIFFYIVAHLEGVVPKQITYSESLYRGEMKHTGPGFERLHIGWDGKDICSHWILDTLRWTLIFLGYFK